MEYNKKNVQLQARNGRKKVRKLNYEISWYRNS